MKRLSMFVLLALAISLSSCSPVEYGFGGLLWIIPTATAGFAAYSFYRYYKGHGIGALVFGIILVLATIAISYVMYNDR